MTANPRIRARTWLTGRGPSAGPESALRGWRLRMSLVYRRRLMPVRPETVVVWVPGPLAPGSPAQAPVGHTHQHTYLSYHQHVRQMFRQYRGAEPGSAARRTNAASVESLPQPYTGAIPADRFLRTPGPADRDGAAAPRRRSTDRVEHQQAPQLPSRLMYRAATASSATSDSPHAATPTRVAQALRFLRVAAPQPEPAETRYEPQRTAPLCIGCSASCQA
jgi:hypothetical protein